MYNIRGCPKCGHTMIETITSGERVYQCINCNYITYDLLPTFWIRTDNRTSEYNEAKEWKCAQSD